MKHLAFFRVTRCVYQQILSPPVVNAVACMCVVFIYNSIMFLASQEVPVSPLHLQGHLWHCIAFCNIVILYGVVFTPLLPHSQAGGWPDINFLQLLLWYICSYLYIVGHLCAHAQNMPCHHDTLEIAFLNSILRRKCTDHLLCIDLHWNSQLEQITKQDKNFLQHVIPGCLNMQQVKHCEYYYRQ